MIDNTGTDSASLSDAPLHARAYIYLSARFRLRLVHIYREYEDGEDQVYSTARNDIHTQSIYTHFFSIL